MKINAIGLWTLRIVLAIGMIVGGCISKTDVSGGCGFVLVLSFFFLGLED